MACCACLGSSPVLAYREPRESPEILAPPTDLLHTLKDALMQVKVTAVLTGAICDVVFMHSDTYYSVRVCINGYEPYATETSTAHLRRLVAPRPAALVYMRLTAAGRLARCDMFLDRRCTRTVASEMLAADMGMTIKEEVYIQSRLRDVNETHAVISFRSNAAARSGSPGTAKKAASIPQAKGKGKGDAGRRTRGTSTLPAASRGNRSPETQARMEPYNFAMPARSPAVTPTLSMGGGSAENTNTINTHIASVVKPTPITAAPAPAAAGPAVPNSSSNNSNSYATITNINNSSQNNSGNCTEV